MREGKHTAASVCRIAREQLTALRAAAQDVLDWNRTGEGYGMSPEEEAAFRKLRLLTEAASAAGGGGEQRAHEEEK